MGGSEIAILADAAGGSSFRMRSEAIGIIRAIIIGFG